MNQKVCSIVGCSNVGKTTLIERLVDWFKSHGINVGVIKHASHGFDLVEGKDSTRFFNAGAQMVWVFSEQKGTMRLDNNNSNDIISILNLEQGNVDLFLLEGFKTYPFCRVWVRKDMHDGPPEKNSLPTFVVGPFERVKDGPPKISNSAIEAVAFWTSKTLKI